MRVVGIDGCRAGWLCVVYDETSTLTPQFQPTFAAVLASCPDAACIGIDIPIGLGEHLPRECDTEARRLLGWPRRASVFAAPPRSLLASPDHRTAVMTSQARFGRGVSAQAFGIFRKVREVDAMMRPEFQQRVVEVHPEVSFWAMACGRPMTHSKKTEAGFAERRLLLSQAFPAASIPSTRAEARRLAPCGGPDDLLDAMAAAWTALRAARDEACRLPGDPPHDERGLRMEIVY
jgi:predicted RNase H-like nuclease